MHILIMRVNDMQVYRGAAGGARQGGPDRGQAQGRRVKAVLGSHHHNHRRPVALFPPQSRPARETLPRTEKSLVDNINAKWISVHVCV